jgi:hypothetical protein
MARKTKKGTMMGQPAEKLSADDLWPLAKKLPREERLQLAKLLLRGTSTRRTDAEAYTALPPGADELSSDEAALGWEGEGWEEFYAKG